MSNTEYRTPKLYTLIFDIRRWILEIALLFATHSKKYPIRPSETILVRVLSTTCFSVGTAHVVFLGHLASCLVNLKIGIHPTRLYFSCHGVQPVVNQTFVGNPLKGRPTIGCVPLLSAELKGGDESTGLQELIFQHFRNCLGLRFVSQFKEEGK